MLALVDQGSFPGQEHSSLLFEGWQQGSVGRDKNQEYDKGGKQYFGRK
jgi:hypothetical protein